MGLSSVNRLRRPAEFRRVLKHGRSSGSAASDGLHLVSVAPGMAESTRFGLSVSKRVGGAVARNRVKRRLREISRDLLTGGVELGSVPVDVVVTARPSAVDATYDDMEASIRRLVAKSIARSQPGRVLSSDRHRRGKSK